MSIESAVRSRGGAPAPVDVLLRCCAPAHSASGGFSQAAAIAGREVEWDKVLQLAQRHRVLPLLYRAVAAAPSGIVPSAVSAKLRHEVYLNTVRNLFLSRELIRVLRLLERQGVAAIPFKGPALAAAVYGGVALRQFGDLDILVAARDYDRARRILVEQGFQQTAEHEWERELVDPSRRVAVDLHRRLAPRDFPSPLAFEFLAPRLQPVAMSAAATVSTLCLEDSLLMLAVQVTKDSNVPLGKLCDIAELLARDGAAASRALENARRLGGRRMLQYSVQLASDLLQLPPGSAWGNEDSFRLSVDCLLADRRRRFYDDDESPPDPRVAASLRWIREERFRDRLRSLYRRYVRDVLVPCELDRELVPLPAPLRFLYYLVRPARLTAKYASRWTRPVMRSAGTRFARSQQALGPLWRRLRPGATSK